MVKAW